MSGVREWLEGRGLGQYAGAFEREEIALEDLPRLTDGDLEKLGLPMGPRKRLLAAVEAAGDAPSALETAPQAAERRQITVMFCDLVGSTRD